jgi:hypothetical protein
MDMTFVSTCWVVERRTPSKTEYASWEISYEEQGLVWVTEWDRALKFYDRASCEMLCREMSDDWDIRIMEHQIVDSPAEVKGRELTAEVERLKRVVEQYKVFIECTASDLHNRRCTDWDPEGAHNAASQMSEDMRLIGNAMIDAVAHIDDESGFKSKENGGKFFVQIESSQTVSGVELVEMAKELGWEENES